MANQMSPSPYSIQIVAVMRPVIIALHTDEELETAQSGGTTRPGSGQIYPRGQQ